MIHELLFNLWHNPGNDIIADDSDWTHLFELPQFLHPGETKLLEMIIKIGVDYHRITSFIVEVQNQHNTTKSEDSHNNSNNVQGDLYLNAFCNGLYDVLEDYRLEIVNLEKKFLEYPQLSLAYIFSNIEKYRGLFDVLKSIIQKINSEDLHGCLLLSVLTKYVNSGIDQIEKSANIIIKSVNTIFYYHLCNWIVCGELVDPYNNFFVCDGKTADKNFLSPEQLLETTKKAYRKSKIEPPAIIRKFYINWDLVPTFINEDFAESILFMGRIVWIVRNDPKRESIADYQTVFRRDIWEGKQLEYWNKLQSLGEEQFDSGKFKKIIEECRIKLTKFLWSLMLDEGHLIQHLKLIREYYGLGRGELFQQFLTAYYDTSLKNLQYDSTLNNINALFEETSRKIYGDNDKNYLRFEFSSSKAEISKTNPWQDIQLNFQIEWPLHIVFHPEVMKFYNKLFCFLLKLKKTQISLFKLWSNHTLSKQKIDSRVWTLRQNLMFLVNNLQYYMQVTVIEAEFSTLLTAVERANEFEDVIKIHHEFVTNLLAKSFVLTPDEAPEHGCKHRLYQMPALQHNVPSKVHNVINKLLELCDSFCRLASMWQTELSDANLEELEIIQKRADIIIETLLFGLYSLHEKVKGGHLLQLLLHLDFNKYFSKNKADLNLTGTLGMH